MLPHKEIYYPDIFFLILCVNKILLSFYSKFMVGRKQRRSKLCAAWEAKLMFPRVA